MADEIDAAKLEIFKALIRAEEARAPALEARVGMLEAGLRELFAAVESGNASELKDAMDLARGLLMQSESDDDTTN